MPRPENIREIKHMPDLTWFKPTGVPMHSIEEVVLSFDEIEAVRLADHEGLYQEQVAEQMKVSRQTVGRILTSARGKIADALVNGKAIRMEGGAVVVREKTCCGKRQRRRQRGACKQPNAKEAQDAE
ncbi:DUF134 domain-containing protein [Pontiella agarivorans]|uniref:UPF0251 protein P9H32_05120 n=1 Tax=Pontiella agarivorans TaxID=3038953 RepID=A0ABU5MUW5_9BACT|nr:DUF134 domain-containing protein [Pontiella agarivorans]MDZ8118002.1 DUF134 domain-containing protein [Pontiella agarivorans]